MEMVRFRIFSLSLPPGKIKLSVTQKAFKKEEFFFITTIQL